MGYDRLSHAGADAAPARSASQSLYGDQTGPGRYGQDFATHERPSGTIKPEWLKLFTDFQDRFVIGTDQHYPQSSGPQRWQAAVRFFNQLPAAVQQKIGTENAIRIYNLK
jgi:predicted TIM-barrel fold metal-dependent hydrolase